MKTYLTEYTAIKPDGTIVTMCGQVIADSWQQAVEQTDQTVIGELIETVDAGEDVDAMIEEFQK